MEVTEWKEKGRSTSDGKAGEGKERSTSDGKVGEGKERSTSDGKQRQEEDGRK